MRQGAHYHRMIQQYFLGIDSDRLSALIHDPDLERWWVAFMDLVEGQSTRQLFDKATTRFPEVTLTASLVGARLVAKCDLILVGEAGKVMIFDWKTSQKRPRRSWLAARLQTRLYPYLLVRAGSHLNLSCSVDPEQVEMIYWFADFPDEPINFKYRLSQYRADENYLSGLIATIKSLGPQQFHLTENLEHCRFCVYRSLCNRGVEAGYYEQNISDLERPDLLDDQIDFEQIAGIEF